MSCATQKSNVDLTDMTVSFGDLKHLVPSLINIIEPCYGLLDQLGCMGVLIHREVSRIRVGSGIYKQNERLLQCLETKFQDVRQLFFKRWTERSSNMLSTGSRVVDVSVTSITVNCQNCHVNLI